MIERDYRLVEIPEVANLWPAPLWLFERKADREERAALHTDLGMTLRL